MDADADADGTEDWGGAVGETQKDEIKSTPEKKRENETDTENEKGGVGLGTDTQFCWKLEDLPENCPLSFYMRGSPA